MSVWKHVVTLQKKSLIANDAVQNTWVTSGSSGTVGAAHTALIAFYLTNDAFMSNALSTSTNMNTIESTLLDGHLDGSPAGPPSQMTNWTLGATGTTAAPNEVACCITIHGDLTGLSEFVGATRPRAQRRGRIFLGPFSTSTSVIDQDATTKEPFFKATFCSSLAASMHDLLAALVTGSQPLHVWSRASASTHAVNGGWVDNAFDTQRRRGNEATTRSIFIP